jgi:hypothetical protein
MTSNIKQELPIVNIHNFDPNKSSLKELSFKNIFLIRYSYDKVRTDLPLNIFLDYVQIIKLGKFNTIMVNLENSKNFLNIHTMLCSFYNCTKPIDKNIFIKFHNTVSRLTLIPAKSSDNVPIHVTLYEKLESTFTNFYKGYNLKGKLIITPIVNLNTSTISYRIIDGEISYSKTFIENSIKDDIHKVKTNSNIHITL